MGVLQHALVPSRQRRADLLHVSRSPLHFARQFPTRQHWRLTTGPSRVVMFRTSITLSITVFVLSGCVDEGSLDWQGSGIAGNLANCPTEIPTRWKPSTLMANTVRELVILQTCRSH